MGVDYEIFFLLILLAGSAIFFTYRVLRVVYACFFWKIVKASYIILPIYVRSKKFWYYILRLKYQFSGQQQESSLVVTYIPEKWRSMNSNLDVCVNPSKPSRIVLYSFEAISLEVLSFFLNWAGLYLIVRDNIM